MKNIKEHIKFGVLAVGSFFAVYFLLSLFPASSFNLNDFSYRYVYSLSSKAKNKPARIIGIEVDNYSLEKISQRYPFKREVYARLLRFLNSEKVNTVGFDFIFSGESEDPQDDLIFQEALKASSCRVVLAYRINPENYLPSLPLESFGKASYGLGFLNTPEDKDGLMRRLRAYVELQDGTHYSFAVMVSSAFSNRNAKELIADLPLFKDKTFLVNYRIKSKDIIRVSMYDILENPAKFKKSYGNNFLNDSLVVVYPAAEILHDTTITPLGIMSGGILHINGINAILTQKPIKRVNSLLVPFFVLSFLVILYLLRHLGFIYGILFTIGLIFLEFWCLVLLHLKGIIFDYSFLVMFNLLFFVSGSLYKYIDFLAQFLKIRIKATMDPLRNVFTLRYFYYRMELALKQIYFSKNLFLVFIHLDSFKFATAGMDLDRLKVVWDRIHEVINLRSSFWSTYSSEELIGCLVSEPAKIEALTVALRNNLGYVLQEQGVKAAIKLGFLRFHKAYPVRELLFVLSEEMKKRQEDLVNFRDADMDYLLHSSYPKVKETDKILESLEEDIEEKNRQLLVLIENLNLEHTKTREAFLGIIASLAKALEARDPYTEGHSQRVTNYALMTADKLGWGGELKEKLNSAALLHDLGKIGIPDSILHKKGVLTDEEYDFIKKHELISIKILEPLKDIKEVLPWIMYHHERWDGSGYPHGLAGNSIPLGAQIIALADTFDAITTGRDYKKALSIEEALNEIIKFKGSQFNPQLVDVFVEAIRISQPQK